MADNDIASLKQFGNTISQSQPKQIKDKIDQNKTNNKKNEQKKRNYKPKINPFIKKFSHISCQLKIIKYQIKIYYRVKRRFQKNKKIQQKPQLKTKGYIRLKETKKQFGNTTILIRRRVTYPYENHQKYTEFDHISGSTLFDIPINDEPLEKRWRK